MIHTDPCPKCGGGALFSPWRELPYRALHCARCRAMVGHPDRHFWICETPSHRLDRRIAKDWNRWARGERRSHRLFEVSMLSAAFEAGLK